MLCDGAAALDLLLQALEGTGLRRAGIGTMIVACPALLSASGFQLVIAFLASCGLGRMDVCGVRIWRAVCWEALGQRRMRVCRMPVLTEAGHGCLRVRTQCCSAIVAMRVNLGKHVCSGWHPVQSANHKLHPPITQRVYTRYCVL